VCSLLSYNSTVLLSFAYDLHVCNLYSYESRSLVILLTNYTHVVCGFLHTCIYMNIKLPIRLNSNGNLKIVPKLFATLKIRNLLGIGKKTRQLCTLLQFRPVCGILQLPVVVVQDITSLATCTSMYTVFIRAVAGVLELFRWPR